MRKMGLGLVAFGLCLCATATGAEMVVDGKIPAGNVIVESIDGDVVKLRQDMRDSNDWFYWAFRVKGAEGRTVRFDFTDPYAGGPVSCRGPAVTRDGGKTWAYAAEGRCSSSNFVYTFAKDEAETWFYQTFQYLPRQWEAFLARHAADCGKVFEPGVLCRSRKGRDVPKAVFGRIDGGAKYRVWLSSRTHCGEAPATYVVEGWLDRVFGSDALGAWLRENVEFMVVPFVDYDGVVDGDQGKGRKPHDHNRDYIQFLYPESRAIVDWITDRAKGKVDVFVDCHSPWVRNRYNEKMYQTYHADQWNTAAKIRWGRLLEKHQTGSMAYSVSNDFPWGFGWNGPKNTASRPGQKPLLGLGGWAARNLTNLLVNTTYEVPFANACGRTVTPQSCREIGAASAAVLKDFLLEMRPDVRESVVYREEVERLPDSCGGCFRIATPPKAAAWKFGFEFAFASDVSRTFDLKLAFGNPERPDWRTLTVREEGSHFVGSPEPVARDGLGSFLPKGPRNWNRGAIVVTNGIAAFWTYRNGVLVRECEATFPNLPLVGWNFGIPCRTGGEVLLNRIVVTDATARSYDRGDPTEWLAQSRVPTADQWDSFWGVPVSEERPRAIDFARQRSVIRFRASFASWTKNQAEGVSIVYGCETGAPLRITLTPQDETLTVATRVFGAGAFANVVRTVRLPNEKLAISGVGTMPQSFFHARPSLRPQCRYTTHEINEIFAAYDRLERLADKVFVVETVALAPNRYRVFLNHQVVSEFEAPSKIVSVGVSGEEVEARAWAPAVSNEPDPPVYRLPLPPGGFALERVRENQGTNSLERGAGFSQDALDAMPGSCCFNVPKRPWVRAKALCGVDPTAPASAVPIVTARLARFAAGGGRSHVLCEQTVDLRRNAACVVRKGDLYEVTFDLDVGPLQDLVFTEDGVSRRPLPYLHFAFTGSGRSASGSEASSLIVYEGSLETDSVVARVAADFAGQADRDVWHYAVPPMSEIQRLADVYPSDGAPNGVVRIVAAKDEYEPGAFLVWARKDFGKVRFELAGFTNESGEPFPKSELDLKFVKVWYQNRNGWFSYFGDTGFKLCPELLLNDEDLIRVDTKKGANYAKLVDKRGGKSELWINPPRQMDVRPLAEQWRKADTFECMRENFRDAATLQPVALPKEEFRSFFLTAHVAKDAKPGLYRGAVTMTCEKDGLKVGEIPVEIRVLDFTLPQPKCYGEPEKDFLVSSYSYISWGLIGERNGGDAALTRKQLVAVLKNQVAHNQTMHMIRGNFDNEAFETIAAMKEAGMRMDVFQGAVSPRSRFSEKMEERARTVADEFDRRYGHHNVYIGHGDEPSAKWLVANRPVFDAYQSAGLKFYIAGETVFPKAGYFYDWHNSARDATDDTAPALWRKMQGASHVAWYAHQHVGAENPALCRRQNGLGAYLTGYTALCNYAHHFGPYNDDRTTYRPMVLAYGVYDGVIDTIAWEGFREGIDDIRYATLMTDLARKAQKSKDLRTRRLGGKAMQYLALTDPKSCDQDSVRGEMVRFINELKPLVAPYDARPETASDDVAAAKAGAARAEANLQRALQAVFAKVAVARNGAETNKFHVAVADVYARFGRAPEGGAYLERVGLFEQALRYYSRMPEKERELSEKIYAANKANFFSRLPDHPEIVRDFEAAVFGKLRANNTNAWRRTIGSLFDRLGRSNHAYVHGVKPQAFAAVYRKLVSVADAWGVALPAATAKNAVWAFLHLHDAAGVRDAARRGLLDEKAKPEVKYYLGLAAALVETTGKPENFLAAVKAYDAGVGDVANKVRVDALCAYGSARMQAGDENAVRGLDDFRKSLYRPEPKKRYVVRFSETPITGFSDWSKVMAERQACDRRYGGDLDFLVTDVTSGERAAGNSGEQLTDPTMEVVADASGLHVLFRQADPKAREVALGLVKNCSFEGYVAPGENTPYSCFMYTPQSGRASIFNTTYPAFANRPLDARTPDRKFRFQSEYVDGEARHYLFFSWENWMQHVPKDGSVWDFENMCWHRSGNSCWNGTESIHGRSTWGELEFRLSPAQRAKILRPLLVKAYAAYNAEKRVTAGHDGALVHWADAEIGDPAFYEARVRPLVEKLDAYGGLIAADMDDGTVAWLAREALPRWQDVAFEVDRRRAQWLLERNAKGRMEETVP